MSKCIRYNKTVEENENLKNKYGDNKPNSEFMKQETEIFQLSDEAIFG